MIMDTPLHLGTVTWKVTILRRSNQCQKDMYTYKITSNKKVCLYKQSVVYPFMQLALFKDNLFLTAADFVDILSYLQPTGISCIWLLKAVLKICAKWNTMIHSWFEFQT